MLMAGEVSVLVYIAFLMLTASIYLPIEGIITFMSMIVMLDAVVGRIKEIKTMPVQKGKKDIDIKITILSSRMFISDMMIIL